MTLIDLGEVGYRRNGGVGFATDSIQSIFQFEKTKEIDLNVMRGHGFSPKEIGKFSDRLNLVKTKLGGWGMTLTEMTVPKRHSGVGVGTATSLAFVEAIHLLNHESISRESLISMSGRGGTSGIGVHSYFDGGFLFDIGRAYDSAKIVPSDVIENPTRSPTILYQNDMPIEWEIGIMVLPDCGVSLESEQRMFDTVLPLSFPAVHKATYHAVFGSVAAIAEKNFSAFCDSVNAIQELEWKMAELQLYGNRIIDCIKKMKEIGVDAVGMSSVGPALYFFSSDFEVKFREIERIFPDAQLLRGRAQNSGRKIVYG